MRKNKLIRLLIHFSKSEIKDFRQFVSSSFFNKNQTLVKLLEVISLFYPTFDQGDFSIEKIYNKIFPGKKFDQPQLTKLLSKLFKLAEQFIKYQESVNDGLNYDLNLLKFYKQKNLSSYFSSTLNRIEKSHLSEEIQNENWLYNKYQIEVNRAGYLSAQPDERKGDINLQQTSDTLDNYYLATKLRHLCYIKNRERTVPFSYRFDLLPEIEQFLQQKTTPHFYISLWYKALQLLVHPKDVFYYNDLIHFLSQHKEQIDKEDTRAIYAYLENTAQSVFKTETAFYQELFSLYKIQLEEGIIYYNDCLIPAIFKNIVTVGLKLKELDWIKTFLNDHKDRILPSYEQEERIYYLCLSMLYFEQHNYTEALSALNDTKSTNIYLKLEVRRMQVKIYYELKFNSLFLDTINTFRKFLSENRKQIAEPYLEGHRNFINMANGIFNTLKKDEKRISSLENKMDQYQILPEKRWILEKIQAIKMNS